VYLEPFSGHEDKSVLRFVGAGCVNRRKMRYPDSMRILVLKVRTTLYQFRLLLLHILRVPVYVSTHLSLSIIYVWNLKFSTSVKKIYSNNKTSIYWYTWCEVCEWLRGLVLHLNLRLKFRRTNGVPRCYFPNRSTKVLNLAKISIFLRKENTFFFLEKRGECFWHTSWNLKTFRSWSRLLII